MRKAVPLNRLVGRKNGVLVPSAVIDPFRGRAVNCVYRRAFAASSPPPLSKVAKAIPASGIRKVMEQAWRLEQQGKALEAVRESVALPSHQRYISNAGLPTLREAVAGYYARRGVEVGAERVVVCTGAVGAFFSCCLALLNPGDEVLLPDPAWPNYEQGIRLAGAVPKPYRLDPSNGWKVDVDSVQAQVSDKTKLLLIVSPSNPVGSVLSQREMQELVDIGRKHDLVVLSDEIYSAIFFGTGGEGKAAEAVSAFEVAHDPAKTVVISGVSKAYSMTGFRVGWLVAGSEHLARVCEKLQEPTVSCGVPFAQEAARRVLDSPDSPAFVASCVREYRARRDAVVAVLRRHGLYSYTPAGAFYVLVPVGDALGAEDSAAFCQRLLQATGVAVSPGATFGASAATFVRVSFAADLETVTEGVDRLCKFIVSESTSVNGT